MSLLNDMFQAPETQITGTVGVSTWYMFTLNEWVGILTVTLLLLQLGLAAHKYYVIWKERRKRRGNKDQSS